jgi:hypothetical protein
MIPDKHNCLRLLMQLTDWAFRLADDRAGSSMAAKMPIMAMTTSNSIKVKARHRREWVEFVSIAMAVNDSDSLVS